MVARIRGTLNDQRSMVLAVTDTRSKCCNGWAGLLVRMDDGLASVLHEGGGVVMEAACRFDARTLLRFQTATAVDGCSLIRLSRTKIGQLDYFCEVCDAGLDGDRQDRTSGAVHRRPSHRRDFFLARGTNLIKQLPGTFQRIVGYIAAALGESSLAVDLNLGNIGTVVPRHRTLRGGLIVGSAIFRLVFLAFDAWRIHNAPVDRGTEPLRALAKDTSGPIGNVESSAARGPGLWCCVDRPPGLRVRSYVPRHVNLAYANRYVSRPLYGGSE